MRQSSTDRAVQSRVYPRQLRRGFAKRNLRFWGTLLSMLLRPDRYRRIRSFVMLSSPDFFRRLVWAYYLRPLPGYRKVALSEQAERHLETLRRTGIVVVERNFAAFADYVRARYFSADFELPADSPLRKNGLEISHSVSFADRRLHEVLFDPEICGIVCNYYGRQAYYRDNPTVHKERSHPGSTPLISGVFHSDAYRQISFMLLLSDLAESDTHMEFAKGSHHQRQPSYDRAHIDQAAVTREFDIAHVVGKKGTLYIFDTEGLHRGAYHTGTGREIFHVNITTGTLRFTDDKYDRLDAIFPEPSRVPEHVKNFVAQAVK